MGLVILSDSTKKHCDNVNMIKNFAQSLNFDVSKFIENNQLHLDNLLIEAKSQIDPELVKQIEEVMK